MFTTARISVQARSSRSSLSVRCELKEGARVRVKAPVTIYHVGKFKEGLNLEGKEGTVVQNVAQYKGQELSANLPWKVEFAVPAPDGGAKPVKVLTHMVRNPGDIYNKHKKFHNDIF